MHSSDRDAIEADFTALHSVVSRILGHSFDTLTTPDRLTYLQRLEQDTRGVSPRPPILGPAARSPVNRCRRY